MITIGKYENLLYNKFGSKSIEKCVDVIKDIIENEFERSIFDDYIECSRFPSKEIMLFVASTLEADGQKEKAEWLRSKAEERIEEKENAISFYWLNIQVENEIQTMPKTKRKHLKQTIDSIVENPVLLDGNYSSVGFVKKGRPLRDIKRHGANNGYRVYFVLMSDRKSCVIIGLSKGKSTTDVPNSEVDHFLDVAENVINDVDVVSLKEANIITESFVGVYSDKVSELTGKLLNESIVRNGDKETIVFFNFDLSPDEVNQKPKDENFEDWLFKRIFGKKALEINKSLFNGYVII